MKNRLAMLASTTVAYCVITFAVALNAQQPTVPKSDDVVLQRLPKTLSLNRDRMASIRERLAADPENVELAVAAAQGFIKMGNDESDPRFYGYARAAIETWWPAKAPSAEIAKIRAKLKEKDHLYLEAISELEELLQRHPRDIQAWVEVANLYRVVGDYEKAWAASQQLDKIADPTTQLVCRAPILAATGRAEEALDLLQKLESSELKREELTPWIVTTQAGIAASLGEVKKADSLYRKALQLNSGSVHLKRTYADFLIDYQQEEPVLALLAEHLNDNGCLLLLAVAANRLGKDDLTSRLKTKLAVRFKEIRLRGSLPHGRFESRYELALNGDPERALEIALENWKLQKEIRDSRAVLESALAAGKPNIAKPAIEFLQQSGCQDAAIIQLIERLGETK